MLRPVVIREGYRRCVLRLQLGWGGVLSGASMSSLSGSGIAVPPAWPKSGVTAPEMRTWPCLGKRNALETAV